MPHMRQLKEILQWALESLRIKKKKRSAGHVAAESLSKANQSCYFNFPLPNITLMKMIIVVHYICRGLSYTSSPSNHKTAFWGRYHSPNYRWENSHSETNLEPKWYLNSGFLSPSLVLFLLCQATWKRSL